MRARCSKQQYGFTLIEVLIVIVVIAIMAIITIPQLLMVQRRAKESSLKHGLQQLRSAVAQFYLDTGAYPHHLTQLISTTPVTEGIDESGNPVTISPTLYKGPYFAPEGGIAGKGLPLDPFIDTNDPARGDHWNYLTAGAKVTVPDAIANNTTIDGIRFNAL